MSVEQDSSSHEPEATFHNAPELELSSADDLAEPTAPAETNERGEQVSNNINALAQDMQSARGVDVGKDWWSQNVPEGTEQQMMAAFALAFDRDFPAGPDGKFQPENKLDQQEAGLEAAWAHYAPYGSPEYQTANQERWNARQLMVRHYTGDRTAVTVIGTINTDDEGGQVLEHDYNVDSPTIHQIEQQFETYHRNTPKEQQVLIVEGGFENATFSSHDQAITEGAEAGLMSFLGKQNGIQVEGGDPSEAEAYGQMLREGVSPIDLAALKAIRGIAPDLRRGVRDPQSLARLLYQSGAQLGVPSFHAYTEAQKQAIVENNQMDMVAIQMSQQVQDKLLPRFNDLTRAAMGGNDLFVVEDGEIRLNLELPLDDPEAVDSKIVPLWHPDGPSELSALWRKNGEIRDKYLFERIAEAERQGKSPFVVFGGPHVVSLEPALNKYFVNDAPNQQT